MGGGWGLCVFFGGRSYSQQFNFNGMNKLNCCYSYSYDLSCIQFDEIVWMVKGNNWLQMAHG